MTIPRILRTLLSALLILAVFIGGMITQKNYGIGNILNLINPVRVSERKTEVIPAQLAGGLDIFILAGQSNMQGKGLESEYSLLPPPDSVFVFTEHYAWQRGKEPVNDGIGPSISFASELLKAKRQPPIGLVNVAEGGTNIGQWSKSTGDKSLYQRLLKRALAASTQGHIKGVLFMQGENDAEGDSTDHYTDWDVQFEKFVTDLRHDLNNDSLPIVFGQLGKGTKPYWVQIKACQQRVNLPLVAMIKTDDLAYQDTSVHYTTQGYIELGKRFAHGYKSLVQSQPTR
jgi:hypothetical protein